MIMFGTSKITYNYSKITDRLYTGGLIADEEEVKYLVEHEGITHVIDAMSEYNDYAMLRLHPKISYIWNGEADDGQPKPPQWFNKAIVFALEAYQTPGAIVYCHCAAGVNRGPSLAYAILRALGFTRSEAFDRVKAKRPQSMIAYKADADRALIELGWTNDKLIGQ
jgi:dual specificity phosphatase 3